MTQVYNVLSRWAILGSFGLMGIVFWIPTTSMAQVDDVMIAVRLPPAGLKIAKSNEAKVTVTVTNVSSHDVKIEGPFFSLAREDMGTGRVKQYELFAGRTEPGGTLAFNYIKLKSGEARSFDLDLGKLFVKEHLSSIDSFSSLLEEVGSGRYDMHSDVYVVYKAKKTLLSSISFKVDVEAAKSTTCGKKPSR